MWLIDDTRDFENQKQFFEDARDVGSFKSFVLKKAVTTLSIYYGLFDQNELVAYYWLMKFNFQFAWKSHEIHVLDAEQGQGLGMFLYEQAILVDKLTVVSDHFQTHYSSEMWDRLRTHPSIEVGRYDEALQLVDWSPSFDKAATYGNDHLHLIARVK